MDHVTLNFINNISAAALFLDIDKAFYTTWHVGLLYKLFALQILISLIKLIGSFLSLLVSVGCKISASRYIQVEVSQGSVLSPTL
jgi:hypothetical protein